MCIRDRGSAVRGTGTGTAERQAIVQLQESDGQILVCSYVTVSYTHLRAHETVLDLVCRLLLEKKTHTRETDAEHSLYKQ